MAYDTSPCSGTRKLGDFFNPSHSLTPTFSLSVIKSLSYTSHDLVHFPSTATTLVHIITVISSLGSHSDHLTAPPPHTRQQE